MKTLAIAVLLAFSIPAQAQMYKCVDEKGKTRYSDKPVPGCKAQSKLAAPPLPTKARPPGKAPPARQAPAQRAARAEPTEHEKAYAASRCKTLKQEEQWLLSPRGAAVQSQAEMLGQVRQALRACR